MSSRRVALVGPEYEENLGLRYLQAALTKAGAEVSLFDFRERGQIAKVTERVLDWRPDVVGLSMTFSRRAREFAVLAAELREKGFAGHLTCGGHFATLHAEQLLRDVSALDTVVAGEAEESLVELLENLANPAKVAGVWFRLDDGKPVLSGPRPVIDDLDAKPWPTREAKPDEVLGLKVADIVAGRGCWGSCHYCSIGAWHRAIGGKRFRQRSLDDLVAEMKALYERGIRVFNFTDDNFFLPERSANLARFAELRSRLDAAGVGKIALQIKARPESVDPDVLEALARLGVFRIFLGVESDSDRTLQALGRNATREQNRRALELIAGAGFHVTYNLLMFEPDTTRAEIMGNLAFIREFAAVPLGLYRTEVYGATPLAQRLQAQGRLKGDYLGYDYEMTDPVAERVYRAQYEALGKRTFDLGEGMAPRAMALDHQLHLLAHFWPERVTESLRERVAAFVTELNEHTCRMLEEMAQVAAEDPSPEVLAEHQRRWNEECAAFDQVMDKRSKRLFVEMAGTARLPREATSSAPVYAVICLLIFAAAFAIVTVFGQNLRALFATSTELGGQVNETIGQGGSAGTKAQAKRKRIVTFGTQDPVGK